MIFEAAIHLGRFLKIQMEKEGLYCISFRLNFKSESQTPKFLIIPQANFSGYKNDTRSDLFENTFLLKKYYSGVIHNTNDENCHYFLINELCIFRLVSESAVDNSITDEILVIEASLLHAKENQKKVDFTEFSVIQTKKLKINLMNTLITYSPIVFDKENTFCVLETGFYLIALTQSDNAAGSNDQMMRPLNFFIKLSMGETPTCGAVDINQSPKTHYLVLTEDQKKTSKRWNSVVNCDSVKLLKLLSEIWLEGIEKKITSKTVRKTIPYSMRLEVIQDEFFENSPEEVRFSVQTLPSAIPNQSKISEKSTKSDKVESSAEIHLVVFCHGYQGDFRDMQTVANYLKYVSWLKGKGLQVRTLLASSYQNDTDESIRHMGKRLAAEVTDYFKTECALENIAKISFVCFSLGGLVARSALDEPKMKLIYSKLHTFLSLAVCHLGYLNIESHLFQKAFWLARKMFRSESLGQLSMEDSIDPKSSLLYELSLSMVPRLFKNWVVFSSAEDKFVPQSSARIEKGSASGFGSATSLQTEMAVNLVSPMSGVDIMKVGVKFGKKQSFVDKLTGKETHISFINNCDFVWEMILFCWANFED